METWKGVIYDGEDYSEWIEISNLGRIRNPKTGKIRKQNTLQGGYRFVNFSMGSAAKKKTIRTHKALAETFIPNPEGKLYVNHIDGNKLNNSLDNLRWVTKSENSIHSHKLGLAKPLKGENNPLSVLTEKDVKYIREYYASGNKDYGARGLARKFNTTHATILRVVNNQSYV